MKENNLKKNTLLNIIKTISSILFPLITFPYISRTLGPDNVGKVNFGAAYVSYFTLLATLGITTYAIRECSAVRNDKEKLQKTSSEIFSINMCTTIISYVFLLVSLVVFRKLDAYRMIIVIQSTNIIFVTLGADWLNSAMEDFMYITLRTIAFQFLSLLLMFVFIHKPEDYMKYAIISVVSASGANILNYFYRKRYCKVKFVWNMKWKDHFTPILFLFVMQLAQTVFNSADITMLGLMKGDYEVGLYTAAVKIQNLVAQIVASLVWVMMPRLSQHFAEQNYKKINDILRKVLGVLLLLGMPMTVGVICLSREIVYIMGEQPYVPAYSALNILMISFFISLFGGSFLGNMVLLPSKREKTFMIICCISTGVNVILNFILIPIGGINAAAGTTAFSAFLILLMLLKTKDKRIKIDNIKGVILSPLLGSILIFAICKLVGIFVPELWVRVVVSITGSVFVYGILLLIMKNEMAMDMFSSVMRRMKK